MTSIKISLMAGALVVASSSAFAQTIAPTIGVDFGSPNYRAYQQDTGLNSYASATRIQTTGPIAQGAYMANTAWQSRARALGAGYVQGGGVSYR
jgi:hypothetical protein